MNTLKSIGGYLWAVAALITVLALFLRMDVLEDRLVAMTGLRISPWMTGGEVARTIERPGYKVIIHRPVFQGLISERENGFVQVDVHRRDQAAATLPTAVPKMIEETIDYNGDGVAYFTLTIDTAASRISLTPLSPAVVGVRYVFHLKTGWAVRVGLKKT